MSIYDEFNNKFGNEAMGPVGRVCYDVCKPIVKCFDFLKALKRGGEKDIPDSIKASDFDNVREDLIKSTGEAEEVMNKIMKSSEKEKTPEKTSNAKKIGRIIGGILGAASLMLVRLDTMQNLQNPNEQIAQKVQQAHVYAPSDGVELKNNKDLSFEISNMSMRGENPNVTDQSFHEASHVEIKTEKTNSIEGSADLLLMEDTDKIYEDALGRG